MSTEELKAPVRAAYERAIGRPVKDDADFFEAGGDSLGAEEVLIELSKAVGLDLPGWLLLDYPSVDALAGALAEMKAGHPVA